MEGVHQTVCNIHRSVCGQPLPYHCYTALYPGSRCLIFVTPYFADRGCSRLAVIATPNVCPYNIKGMVFLREACCVLCEVQYDLYIQRIPTSK
jgi:hypothetical protein